MNATERKFFTTCAPCEGHGALSEPNEDSGLDAICTRFGDDPTNPCEDCHHDGKVACTMCDGAGTLPRRVSKLMRARAVSRLARLRRKMVRLENRASTMPSPRVNLGGRGYWKRRETREVMHRLRGIIAGERECPACDGDGKRDCVPCDGKGYTWDSCGTCLESLEGEDTIYRGDGELVCETCARKAGAFKCAACNETGEIIRTDVTTRGKTFPLTGASCSRCGGRPHNPGENDTNGHKRDDAWFVAVAKMCDTDGVFYAFLCSSEDGSEGCLGDTLDEQDDVPKHRKELLDTLDGCEGDDIDGMVADMEDLDPLARRLFSEEEGTDE